MVTEYKRAQMAEESFDALKSGMLVQYRFIVLGINIERPITLVSSQPPIALQKRTPLIPCSGCLSQFLEKLTTSNCIPSPINSTLRNLQDSMISTVAPSSPQRPSQLTSFSTTIDILKTANQTANFLDEHHGGDYEESERGKDQSFLFLGSNSLCLGPRPQSPEFPTRNTIISPNPPKNNISIPVPLHPPQPLTADAALLEDFNDNLAPSYNSRHASASSKKKTAFGEDEVGRTAESAAEDDWFGASVGTHLPLSSPPFDEKSASQYIKEKKLFNIDSPEDKQLACSVRIQKDAYYNNTVKDNIGHMRMAGRSEKWLEDDGDERINLISKNSHILPNMKNRHPSRIKRILTEPLASLASVFLAHVLLFLLSFVIILVIPETIDAALIAIDSVFVNFHLGQGRPNQHQNIVNRGMTSSNHLPAWQSFN